LSHPAGVVHLSRAVDRDADQELAGLQELAPLVGQQGAVGLDGVQDPLPRLRIGAFRRRSSSSWCSVTASRRGSRTKTGERDEFLGGLVLMAVGIAVASGVL